MHTMFGIAGVSCQSLVKYIEIRPPRVSCTYHTNFINVSPTSSVNVVRLLKLKFSVVQYYDMPFKYKRYLTMLR